MKNITFNNLPDALTSIIDQLGRIESTLEKLVQFDTIKDQFLTISQASKLLNLAESTIYGKVSKREIPVIKKGKKIYFQKEALLNWILEGKRSTTRELLDTTKSFNKKL